MFRSRVFKVAHLLKKQMNFSKALSQSWKIYNLHKELENRGGVGFTVRYNDLTLEYFGTLRNIDHLIKGTNKESKEDDLSVFRFYDIISKEFRAFKIENLLTINTL